MPLEGTSASCDATPMRSSGPATWHSTTLLGATLLTAGCGAPSAPHEKPGGWVPIARSVESAATSASAETKTTPPAPPTPEARARELCDRLGRGEFDLANGTFDPDMASALPTSKLAETWQSLVRSVGTLERCGAAKTSTSAGYDIVILTCAFERGDIDVEIALDSRRRVSGLFFLPSQPPYSPPSYAARDAVLREVTVGRDPWALPGTLSLPAGKGPFPAVVLVHGSGPGDRDETVGANKPFADLASGLAARGIAVLRFDKRTHVHGAKIATDTTFTVREESIDDALAALALLEKTPEIDPKRLFVLGHSLGGTLAPRIAEGAPKLAGVVVMAGATRPLPDVMLEQLSYIASLDGKRSPEEAAQIAAVEVARTRIAEIVGGAAPKPGESLLGAPPAYWRDLAGYDPPRLASKLAVPILVLQGGRDYQVTEVDFEGWKKALAKRPHATTKLYPKLNHLFVSGEAKSVPEEYQVASHVDEEVIGDVASFVKHPR